MSFSLKKINYRHYVCILVTLAFIAVAILAFPYAFKRLLEGFRDFGLSVAYYFTNLFEVGTITPSVNELSVMPIHLPKGFPQTWEDFQICWSIFWQEFLKAENVGEYFSSVGVFLADFSRILLLIITIFVPVFFLLKNSFEKQNNDYNEDTKFLRAFKKISSVTYRPVKRWITEFIDFIKQHRFYLIIWAVIWAYCFNFIVIVLEFFAWYFYFCLSFDFLRLYRQVYKLVVDLSVVITFLPVPVWIAIGLGVLFFIRKKIAYGRLNYFEMKNRGFINERPIVYMIVGTMGKGKTTCAVDMALSLEVMHRDKAFELLLDNDLKFPYFPWINLENDIKNAIENHTIYNLATIRKYISEKRKTFLTAPTRENIYDYDFVTYGLSYNDDLAVRDVWDVLQSYSQLYFIYIVQSSLLIGNLSVRTDNVVADNGNLPLWNTDFFKRDARYLDAYSRHSHILDFDMLRLGKRLIDENKNADMFEFGVIVITEIGKERGNTLENKELKKDSVSTNQKNDLFNSWLKMVRHSATVDGYPFVKVVTDEQRPESWGADARDLCEIIHIRNRSERKLAMPFFSIEELLYDFVFSKFTDLYSQYRFNRGDNTFLMYCLKTIASKFHSYYTRVYNRFGYMLLDVSVEAGTQDGDMSDNKYYLMTKKIYSKRFSTDCYSEFFKEKALRSKIGIDDLPEFDTEKATFDEMLAENSYFFTDLCKMLISKNVNKRRQQSERRTGVNARGETLRLTKNDKE